MLEPRASSFSAKTVFPAYSAVSSPVPGAVWTLLRLATAGVWIGVAALLILSPTFGLKLLWGLIVPVVPLIVVAMPGLWRQICPLAFFNQLPRRFGFSRGADLPQVLQNWAFAIAVLVFLVVVALRQPLFNRVGWMTAALLLGTPVLAFLGGYLFKGRSGWCGTFCPLGPIQRTYGAAPLVNVAQTYCETCVGCQKNCYDFNPKAAVFDDFDDEDPRYANQRRLFFALIPGVVVGYFFQGAFPAYGYGLYLALFLLSILTSIGLYQFSVAFLNLDPWQTAMGFAAGALAIFYWFAGPIVVTTVSMELLGVTPAGLIVFASRFVGVVAALALVASYLGNARVYAAARAAAIAEARAEEAKSAPKVEGIRVIDEARAEPLSARRGQTLLEALSGAGVPVTASCKSGLCGSDAVLVIEGHENLSPPSDDERATLKRLGLEDKARLACCCRVYGPVRINRDLSGASAGDATAVGAPSPAGFALPDMPVSASRLSLALRPGQPMTARSSTRERALYGGLDRVIIVGNGIAGITAADELRKGHGAVGITVLSVESDHFYNRMAINKIAQGKRSVEDLRLQNEHWYLENRIDVRLGARVVGLDRNARQVFLASGQALGYDKLILATGARADVPEPGFLARENGFVLRTAADAGALRDYIAAKSARSCVILGGGVLAVEAAEALCHAGLETTLLVRADRLMNRNIDEEASRLLQRYLERLGVSIRFGVSARQFLGGARLEAAVIEGGKMVLGDVFVAAMGARPEIELAQQCGLETRHGILVNGRMQTSDPDILAIGDVAELAGASTGLWPVGVAQARTAVASLLGQPGDYAEPTMVMRLKSEGMDLRTYGVLEPRPGDEVICAPPFSQAWWKVILRGGRIVGAVHAGPNGQSSPIWKLIDSTFDLASYHDALRAGDLESLEAL